MASIPASRIAFASFIGTAIEFYDFYIYGLAVAMVIGPLFFPHDAPGVQTLNAFLTFGLAFLARPVGALLFGHFGDRVGRKATLAASLLVMGVSTLLIGALPTYAAAGWAAPALLCVLRLGQGIGLGGEWGGAALLATEYAPRGKRGLYGMFPQLGPSVGFLFAVGGFFLASSLLTDAQFRAWGWRLPFLASAVLVAVGLYVRLKLAETPIFSKALEEHQQVRVPLAELLTHHLVPLVQGAALMVVCYALFYITAVFAFSYGMKTLHIARPEFLVMLSVAILFMAAATPLAARAGDRYGRRRVLLLGSSLALLSGFLMQPMLGSGSPFVITVFLAAELFLMGVTYAPMGALLPELFPTAVRYTGAGAAYNLGGILGASLAPYIAARLAAHGGLSWVGGYISAAAAISLIAAYSITETRDREL
ncbi:MAG TPA: MFS transporter [Gallionellaceae bacterium]|nr:MFS transporter [Gallionellaceae bacterium]